MIPLSKYVKAVYHTRVSVGMRFRMLFETEESSVRRYSYFFPNFLVSTQQHMKIKSLCLFCTMLLFHGNDLYKYNNTDTWGQLLALVI